MVVITSQEIARFRSQLAEYPEALEAIQGIVEINPIFVSISSMFKVRRYEIVAFFSDIFLGDAPYKY